MSKVVLYIAQSLDGFIAKPDGNLDWLTSTPAPETGNYGYSELLESIGTIIMGRKTYDVIMGFDMEWSYTGYDTFVVTGDDTLEIKSPDTYAFSGSLKSFVHDLKNHATKDIWLMGGGQLITHFINEDLLDKMIISVIPKIIGEGIPLFAPRPLATEWELISAASFNTGVVNLTYKKPE